MEGNQADEVTVLKTQPCLPWPNILGWSLLGKGLIKFTLHP